MGFFLNVIIGPTAEVLKAYHLVDFVFLTNIVVTIINVILNIVLIPNLGLIGAAIATAAAICLREIVFFLKVRNIMKPKVRWLPYLKYFFAGLVGVVIVYLLIGIYSVDTMLGLTVILLLFLLIYVSVIIFLRGLMGEDLRVGLTILERVGIKSIKLENFLRFLIRE